MTSRKKTSKKSKAFKKAPRKGAAMASRAARITDLGPFMLNAPNQMESFMSQGKNQFDKLASECGGFGREAAEAVNKSLTIFARGFEDIFRATISMAQDAAEKQSQFIKEALSSKTLNEWTEVQNKIAQANFDDAMQAATKLSEMGVRVMTDSAAPLNSQMTKSMKKASEAMAA